MLPLEQARFLLLSATPNSTQWRGAAASSFEGELAELLHELGAIEAALWV